MQREVYVFFSFKDAFQVEASKRGEAVFSQGRRNQEGCQFCSCRGTRDFCHENPVHLGGQQLLATGRRPPQLLRLMCMVARLNSMQIVTSKCLF